MVKKQLLIFDFDGLIIDTESAEVKAWRKEFEEVGLVFDLDAFIETIGANGPEIQYPVNVLVERSGETRTSEQIWAEHNKRSVEEGLKLPPLDGVMELLDRAEEAGILLAVGSSSKSYWVTTLLDGLGIKDRFDTVVTFDDVEFAKPAPDIYLKVLENLGVAPENALVLEDSYNGALAAQRAGIRVVAVPTQLTAHLDFSMAEEVLGSLAELELGKYFK